MLGPGFRLGEEARATDGILLGYSSKFIYRYRWNAVLKKPWREEKAKGRIIAANSAMDEDGWRYPKIAIHNSTARSLWQVAMAGFDCAKQCAGHEQDHLVKRPIPSFLGSFVGLFLC